MIQIDGEKQYLWQWDIGRRVKLRNVPENTKIHFSMNCDTSNAYVVFSYPDSEGNIYANIPNILLQNHGCLSVYVYFEGDKDGRCHCEKRFTIRDREKPADYVYSETEVFTWKSLENRIKALESESSNHADSMEDEETLDLLMEAGIVDPVTDSTGAIYTDNNGTIFVL